MLPYLSLSFNVIIFSVSCYLMQGSSMGKIDHHWCFLGYHFLPSLLEASSDSNRKCSVLGTSAPPFYSVTDATLLLCTLLLSLMPPGSLKFLARGTSQVLYVNWASMNSGHACWDISSAPTHAPCRIGLHLQNTSPKIKLLRISRWWQQGITPSMGPFWAVGPVQVVHSWSWPCPGYLLLCK